MAESATVILQGKKKQISRDYEGSEQFILWFHRISILLTCMMIFFPPFNIGRLSVKISGNLTLLTSATSFSTVTTKLGTYMVENSSRFALKAADMRLSQAGCALVLLGAVLSAIGACASLGNRKMRRIGVSLPILGGVVLFAGLIVNRIAYNRVFSFIQSLDYAESHLEDAALSWPAFANAAWCAGGALILISSVLTAYFSYKKSCTEKAEIAEWTSAYQS